MLCPIQEGPYLKTKKNQPVHELCAFMVPETYVIDPPDESTDMKASAVCEKVDPSSLVPVFVNDTPSVIVPNEANDLSISIKPENSETNGDASLDTLTSSDSIQSKAIVMGIENIPKSRWNLVIRIATNILDLFNLQMSWKGIWCLHSMLLWKMRPCISRHLCIQRRCPSF